MGWAGFDARDGWHNLYDKEHDMTSRERFLTGIIVGLCAAGLILGTTLIIWELLT
jgi:hypothetical protein